MSNSVLHKKQKLVFELQSTVGTAEPLDASSIVLPAEEIVFDLSRGSGKISRAGLNFGGPGTVQRKRGSVGWGISAGVEVQDSAAGAPAALLLLAACGIRWAVDGGGDIVGTLGRDCLLSGFGPPPFGPCVATMWLVEDCGITRKAQDVTGSAVVNLEVGERLMINFELLGRLLQTADPKDSTIATTSTELAAGGNTLGDWGLPYVVESITASIAGETPVNLQSAEIDLNMEVSDALDARALGSMGIVKPENTEGVQVSFNVAQDSINRADFWNRFFDDTPISFSATLTGPNGGQLTIACENLCHDAPATENVNERRHYGITAMSFIDPAELNDIPAAYENFLKFTYTPPTSP